ncbi:hypothetical protein V1292_001744 [Bradyrhizobium sp. AZCC 1719]|uniref:hypothetical protein n=1 Tax=Bradyrhizobium sp. AZCC 1719 TaxID=3117028 RepID=UPI002FF3CD1C
MKLSLAATVAAGILLVRPGFAQEVAVPWMTEEKLAAVRAIGIDPEKDIEAKGNYHWRYKAHRPLTVGGYSCPVGTMVGISRNIMLVLPPEHAACRDAKGGDVRALRLLPNGAAEAM